MFALQPDCPLTDPTGLNRPRDLTAPGLTSRAAKSSLLYSEQHKKASMDLRGRTCRKTHDEKWWTFHFATVSYSWGFTHTVTHTHIYIYTWNNVERLCYIDLHSALCPPVQQEASDQAGAQSRLIEDSPHR